MVKYPCRRVVPDSKSPLLSFIEEGNFYYELVLTDVIDQFHDLKHETLQNLKRAR